MTMQESLGEMLEYDLWANRRWFLHLQERGFPEPDAGILRHALAASEIWLRRCEGNSPTAMPAPELSERTMVALSADWKAVVANIEGNPLVAYRRTNGQALETRFFDIARHVVNHGTYHRGELRGLCRARGDEDFPETDFVGWVFERG